MLFKVWNEEDGEEDARNFEALDAESAAKRWAQWDDYYSADYLIARGQACTVCVRDATAGSLSRFLVSGESEPVYRAQAID